MGVSAENEIFETALLFMESKEMAEHLRKEKSLFDGWRGLARVSDIITGSCASLEDKLAALRLVLHKYTAMDVEVENVQKKSDNEEEAIVELGKLINAAEFILHETTENTPVGTLFLLRSCYLTKDDVVTTDDWEDCVPFASFDAAKSCLRREAQRFRETCGEEADYKSYTISKWTHTRDDAMRRVITWYLSNEGVIWFADINEHFDERLRQIAADGRDLDDLNHELSWLTVPYVPGDIVTIDCRPTHEVSHAVIAEIHDGGHDCCGIQVIHMTEGGELQQSALKHDINRGHVTLFTCMYRLEKNTGALPPWEAPLKKVSDLLKSDPMLGRLNDEGSFFSRTDFLHHLANFLPDSLSAGDVIRIRRLCDSSALARQNLYAVVVDKHGFVDDVTIILYDDSRYDDHCRLRKTTLRHELGSISRYSIEQCANDLPGNYMPLHTLGEEIKRNPSVADDEAYIKRINKALNEKGYRHYGMID